MEATRARLLDLEHYATHRQWRLKHFQGAPLRGCHIRVFRQLRTVPVGLPSPVEASLPPATYEAKQNQALRNLSRPPHRRTTYGGAVTDIFRFAQTSFPTVLLEQLGAYWVIPSVVPHRRHVYLTRQQIYQIDPVHWTITKSLSTTRYRWRRLLRRALNK